MLHFLILYLSLNRLLSIDCYRRREDFCSSHHVLHQSPAGFCLASLQRRSVLAIAPKSNALWFQTKCCQVAMKFSFQIPTVLRINYSNFLPSDKFICYMRVHCVAQRYILVHLSTFLVCLMLTQINYIMHWIFCVETSIQCELVVIISINYVILIDDIYNIDFENLIELIL